jgi:hypothetical protein
MTLQRLREMHREIIPLVVELIAISERGDAFDGLPAARAALAAAISDYLALKEIQVITPLRESDNCAHRAMARRCALEDVESRHFSAAHAADWTLAVIRRHPREYRTVLRQILRMLQRRADYQEQVVFPMVREALAARAQVA